MLDKLVGSPYWMAPEVLNNSSSSYDASKADIWSFGITLIELLRGRPPLYYLSPRAAMSTIPRTSPPRLESDDPGASKTLRELIHSCLHDDPRKRPSASQLLKSFKSYFKNQSTLTGSLARLQKPNSNHRIEAQDGSSEVTARVVSETIYSQWDFDLSTLKADESIEADGSIEAESLKTSVIVKQSEQTTYDTTDLVVIQPRSPVKSPTTVTQVSRTVKFRRLSLTAVNQNGWKDKDRSLLPIPCPSDAPDLSRAQL